METEKKRQVKGSVLFTVVSVMSLLIIFLMGTLVLAASVNNRAHKSYSSSQTQYTARTAVDSILAAVGDGTAEGQAFATAVQSLNTLGQTLNVDVNIGDSSLGRVDNAVITLVNKGDYPVYDSDNQKWVYCDRLSITADVTLGGTTTTMTSYVLKDAPASTKSGGNPAGFMARGDFSGTNHTSAFGGMYIGMGYDWMTKDYTGINDPDPANRGYLTGKTYALGNGSAIEAPLYIDGSLASNVSVDIVIPSKGEGITIWGDLGFQNNSFKITTVNLSNFDSNTNNATPNEAYNFVDIPYIYVDGVFGKKNLTFTDPNGGSITTNDGTEVIIGDGTFPLNVFCGSFIAPNAKCQVYGDIYCFDSESTSVLRGNPSNLYSWTASVVKGGTSYNNFGGSFYSKGSLEASGSNVRCSKDIRVEKNATIDGITIHGDLIVGENLTISNATVFGNVICKGSANISNCKLYKNLSVEGSLSIDANSQKYLVNVYNDDTSGASFDQIKPGYDFYENDLHVNEILPGYTEQPNDYHDNELKPGYTAYENDPAVFEEWNCGEHKNDQYLPTDKFGNVAKDSWGNIFWGIIYYAPDGTAYTSKPGDYYKKDASGNTTTEYTNSPFIYYETASGNEKWENEAKGSYYTRWDDPTVVTDKAACYYDSSGNEVDKSVAIPGYYYTQPFNGNAVTYEGITFYLASDPAKTPVDRDDAVEVKSVGDASTSPFKDVEIYPAYAEKKIVLGLEQLMNGGTPVDKSETQVVKTVYDKMTELGTDLSPVTSIPTNVDVTSKVYDGLDDFINDGCKITNNCTITSKDENTGEYKTIDFGGSVQIGDKVKTMPADRTITIVPPENGVLWIKLKDLSIDGGPKFIVDDTASNAGTVNFYIEGEVKFSGNGSRIVTKKWNDIFESGQEIWITTDSTANPIPSDKLAYKAPAPNIHIYSTPPYKPGTLTPYNSKLIIGNMYLMSAYMEAPYLEFRGGDFATISNTVYYNNYKVNTTQRANFGCAICQVGSFSNDWTNYFIPDDSSSAPPVVSTTGLGTHTYEAVEYWAY